MGLDFGHTWKALKKISIPGQSFWLNWSGCSSLGDLNDSNVQPGVNSCLQDQLTPDCLLLVGYEETVPLGFISLQLINAHFRCLEKLQPAYQVTFPGQEPIVKKGKICPIDITLAQRASNKKVVFKKAQCLKMVI